MTGNPTHKVKIGPMLRMVLGAGALLSPLAAPLLKRRLAQGKEEPDRWREKLGEATAPRPDGPMVWLHGVGVGEVMALRGLIVGLAAARPDLQFLVTSSARSSAQVIARNLPPRTQHQYLPLDFPTPVRAFLDHWRPDMAVWSDQEVWPRLAVASARRGIPQALVAARITDASGRAKQRFGAAYGDLYRLLDARHAQDESTAAHLSALMGDDTPVHITGSLKATAAPLADDEAARKAVMQASGRAAWVVASAHEADIDVALDAHQLAQCHIDIQRLLIIAPRNITDAAKIETACAKRSMASVRRSTGALPNGDTEVYIADTYGELGLWYRAGFAALIGGTFDKTEGHNPWEAVAVGCSVLHGPRVRNFASDFKSLTKIDAVRAVINADDIATALNDPALPDLADRAMVVRQNSARGVAQVTEDLLRLLER